MADPVDSGTFIETMFNAIKAEIEQYQSELGYQVLQLGDLSHLPAPEEFSELLPGIFINPKRVDFSAIDAQRTTEYQECTWKVVFAREYEFDEEKVKESIRATNALVSYLKSFAATDLGNLKFQDNLETYAGKVDFAEVTVLDFDSEEDRFFKNLGWPVTCAVIELKTKIKVRRIT